VADAVFAHWADRLLPRGFRPYARLARLERPTGWWLLALPGWWGICLGQVSQNGGVPDFKLMLLFLMGAIIMRGAGCTLNDIVDRDIDAHVARTRSRPLPSGQVSVKEAFLFLVALLGLGFIILLQLNNSAIVLGATSLALVAVYPFMKRLTHWPQLVLGLAFNWGALLGYAAVTGGVEAAAMCLYVGGVCWTLAYDTIYAHQDKEDDALIGVKSTALKFGAATKTWLLLFFFSALVLIGLAGVLAGASAIFHLGVVLAGVHGLWQVSQLDIESPDNCLRLFRSNRDFGLLIFAGAFLASVTA
jgi:4-hydroxybenzoate polyprenyltransferase